MKASRKQTAGNYIREILRKNPKNLYFRTKNTDRYESLACRNVISLVMQDVLPSGIPVLEMEQRVLGSG